jgi:hypothetical protein
VNYLVVGKVRNGIIQWLALGIVKVKKKIKIIPVTGRGGP